MEQNLKAQQTCFNKSSFVVIASVKVNPGKEEIFKEAVSHIVPLTIKEEGNYCYIFHQSNDDSTEFSFYEQWESEEHLKTHLNAPHMKNFIEEVDPIIVTGSFQIKCFNNVLF